MPLPTAHGLEAAKEHHPEPAESDTRIHELEAQVKSVKMVEAGGQEEIKRLNDVIKHLTKEMEELKHLVQTDELTGLLNRNGLRALAPILFGEYHRISRAAERRGEQRALNEMRSAFNAIYIDLNDFSEINNKLDHTAGDEALKKVAEALKSVVRGEHDRVIRIGGDEFVVLFISNEAENKTTANRFVLAERIKRALEKTGFTYHSAKSGPVDVPPMTAMIGVAQFERRPGDISGEAPNINRSGGLIAGLGEGLNEVIQAADLVALKLKAKKEKEIKEGTYEPRTEIAYAQDIDL